MIFTPAYASQQKQMIDLMSTGDPVADLVYKILFAFVFLVIGAFSLWYAGRLALIRHITYKTALLITLIAYVVLGLIRTVMIWSGVYAPGMLWIPILIAITLEIFVAKYFLRSTWVKTVIAVVLGNVMTVIIVLPVFVVAGSLWAYLLASKGS